MRSVINKYQLTIFQWFFRCKFIFWAHLCFWVSRLAEFTKKTYKDYDYLLMWPNKSSEFLIIQCFFFFIHLKIVINTEKRRHNMMNLVSPKYMRYGKKLSIHFGLCWRFDSTIGLSSVKLAYQIRGRENDQTSTGQSWLIGNYGDAITKLYQTQLSYWTELIFL